MPNGILKSRRELDKCPNGCLEKPTMKKHLVADDLF